MPIFQRFLEELAPLVPSVYRRMPQVVIDAVEDVRTSKNILNLIHVVPLMVWDTFAEALREYSEETWPLDGPAAGWVLDQHWGPAHNIQRNGMSDGDYRTYIHAKRLLNKSWGATDQLLEILTLLLPAATLQWVPFYPKAWVVYITGIDMATALPALKFLEKKPSPQGGGFSVCGDNGMGVIVDPQTLNYSSVYGVLGVDYVVTGWYGSEYGVGGGAQAGHAHVGAL